jgi:hypothetical protein
LTILTFSAKSLTCPLVTSLNLFFASTSRKSFVLAFTMSPRHLELAANATMASSVGIGILFAVSKVCLSSMSQHINSIAVEDSLQLRHAMVPCKFRFLQRKMHTK